MAAPGDKRNLSKLVASALSELSELDNSEKLRDDAIMNGKAIIANWREPTDDEINKIFQNLKRDILEVAQAAV